jgi:hypothetical protein
MVRSGKDCLAKGIKYENEVFIDLLRIFEKDGWSVGSPAGAKNVPDITMTRGAEKIPFECKTFNAFEGGQETLKLVNGHFEFRGEILWDGKVPACLTDKNYDTYLKEKKPDFDDISIPTEDRSTVAKYYKNKGIYYISVEGRGLYHTGEDPLGLGVPLFEADTVWRIRLKYHSMTNYSITASNEYVAKSLKRSNKNLQWWHDNHL